VGTPYRSTPDLRSEITAFTFNPTWTIPPTVMREDVLPRVRTDADYLADRQIRVLDQSGQELDPALVDWERPEGVLLRQDAGPANALGRVAIRFPNPHAVFLHDTPNKRLFERGRRAFSSGCIRVENPLELIELLFDDPERWNRPAIERLIAGGRTRDVALPRPVPILLLYWTVDVHPDGRIAFKPDIYGRDAPLLQALTADRR
jgi:murein L,D-transpeptidase YcbB/YkuD